MLVRGAFHTTGCVVGQVPKKAAEIFSLAGLPADLAWSLEVPLGFQCLKMGYVQWLPGLVDVYIQKSELENHHMLLMDING